MKGFKTTDIILLLRWATAVTLTLVIPSVNQCYDSMLESIQAKRQAGADRVRAEEAAIEQRRRIHILIDADPGLEAVSVGVNFRALGSNHRPSRPIRQPQNHPS